MGAPHFQPTVATAISDIVNKLGQQGGQQLGQQQQQQQQLRQQQQQQLGQQQLGQIFEHGLQTNSQSFESFLSKSQYIVLVSREDNGLVWYYSIGNR
jgi:hypothetical protein